MLNRVRLLVEEEVLPKPDYIEELEAGLLKIRRQSSYLTSEFATKVKELRKKYVELQRSDPTAEDNFFEERDGLVKTYKSEQAKLAESGRDYYKKIMDSTAIREISEPENPLSAHIYVVRGNSVYEVSIDLSLEIINTRKLQSLPPGILYDEEFLKHLTRRVVKDSVYIAKNDSTIIDNDSILNHVGEKVLKRHRAIDYIKANLLGPFTGLVEGYSANLRN